MGHAEIGRNLKRSVAADGLHRRYRGEPLLALMKRDQLGDIHI